MAQSQGRLISPLRLLEQNATDWVAYKHKFNSHSCGGWKVQDHGARMAALK